MHLVSRLVANRPLRYLVVGGWNTLFGAAVYALLYYLWGERVHYLVLLIPANILAITNAFFGYKFLVFNSRGKFWREYLRCYVVYGGAALFNAVMLYLLVTYLRISPPLANFLCIFSSTVISYFAHKNFSFH